jgi:hypothetical protein
MVQYVFATVVYRLFSAQENCDFKDVLAGSC